MCTFMLVLVVNHKKLHVVGRIMKNFHPPHVVGVSATILNLYYYVISCFIICCDIIISEIIKGDDDWHSQTKLDVCSVIVKIWFCAIFYLRRFSSLPKYLHWLPFCILKGNVLMLLVSVCAGVINYRALHISMNIRTSFYDPYPIFFRGSPTSMAQTYAEGNYKPSNFLKFHLAWMIQKGLYWMFINFSSDVNEPRILRRKKIRRPSTLFWATLASSAISSRTLGIYC